MKQTDEVVFVYTTLPDQASAERIANHLVETFLAACCNILAPMTSVYRWQGEVQADAEIPMLIKTRRALVDEVEAAARALHPYDVPCFLTLGIDAVNAPYFAWATAAMRS